MYERRRTKKGQWSKREYVKVNRAGNVHTKNLHDVITGLEADPSSRLPQAVKANLDALTEIRDNAVHFINTSPDLAKQIHEIGTASVTNYFGLAHRWFNIDLSHREFYVMAIGFVEAPSAAAAVRFAPNEDRLLKYLIELVRKQNQEDSGDFYVSLEVRLDMKKSATGALAQVGITTDPSAPQVTLGEENIRNKYPWNYDELTKLLRKRYQDFKANNKYHSIRIAFDDDPRYVHIRRLDQNNPRSSAKRFFNPNFLREFDTHYQRTA